MKKINRREVCVALPALAIAGAGAVDAQEHASEFPAKQNPAAEPRTAPPNDKPGPMIGGGTLGAARAIPLEAMASHANPNGGEGWQIAEGSLATGERVSLHESMLAVGAPPNPPHTIEHSEFILIRDGELEFEHEVDGKMVAGKAGPGGVLYVAYGTRHTVKNVGAVPARYFVIAIGGDTT